MISQSTLVPDQLLLNDLLGELSMPTRPPAVSAGLIGSTVLAPQPPSHCLRACLSGNPEVNGNGACAFLRSATRGNIDMSLLNQGRCPKGFQVGARRVSVGREPAVVLTVAGSPVPGDAEPDASALLAHLDTVAHFVQRIGQLVEENAGFADELLQNYEQLNLIFDLTQQIAQLTDVPAIEGLLLQRIARLLDAAAVYVVTPDGECRAFQVQAGPSKNLQSVALTLPAEAAATLTLVRESRQVHVATAGAHHVLAGPLVGLDDKVKVVLATRPADRPVFMASDMMLCESVLAVGGQIISNSELTERLRRMSFEVTRALVAAIDKKDHYTSGHSERVGLLTRLIAQQMGLRPTEVQIMEWAGLLHDIGKIGIPEEILCKPGKLTSGEFELVKQHPEMGHEILRPIASFELVLDGVRYHHEHPDGSGYPEGLEGRQIPLVARIIRVADTFDALTSTRSYRGAFSIEKALEIIRSEQGSRIDSEVAEAFFLALAAYRRDDPDGFAANFCSAPQREVEHAPC